MGSGFLIGLVVALLVMGIGFLVALTVKRSYLHRPPLGRQRQLEAPWSPAEARQRVVTWAVHHGYKVEENDLDRGVVTLSSSPTAFSWGFYLPVYLDAADDGGSRVTVGIQSRFVQFGPVVTHHHDKLVNGLRSALAS